MIIRSQGTTPRIGFMQGRLSPLVNGKIQAFPRDHWRDEIRLAGQHGYPLIEWTLDHDGLNDNPLMTEPGRREIRGLLADCRVDVISVTADCFMQAPFFKAEGSRRRHLFDQLRRVLEACNAAEIAFLVIPLVDDGRIESDPQRDDIVASFGPLLDGCAASDTRVIFESDFAPDALKSLMIDLPDRGFGINYDIGNSAAAGFDPEAEIAAYGDYILNVHVKDRILGGTTVPLGDGDARFPEVFEALRRGGYEGDYILQTARATNNDHLGTLNRFRDMVRSWIWDAA